jgi:hypothetical protein
MPVIINEFEVVAESGSATETVTAEAQPPAVSLPAHEVARIVCHEHERALRCWAH